MHRRHTDPVQLQAAGVSGLGARGRVSGEGSACRIQAAVFKLLSLALFSLFWQWQMGELYPWDPVHLVSGLAQW